MRPGKLLALCLALWLAAQPALLLASESEALEDTGNGASIATRVVSKVLSTGRFDLGATVELFTDPGTLTGILGGVVGFTLGAKLAALFLPPGVGIFVSVLPQFLGGALGFELARGRGDKIDPIAMATQVLASAGGYSLFRLLLGASAPGWALMIGATVFGVLVNLITRKKPMAAAPRPPDGEEREGEAGTGDAPGTRFDGTPPGPAAASSALDAAYLRVLEAVRIDPAGVSEAHRDYDSAFRSLQHAREAW